MRLEERTDRLTEIARPLPLDSRVRVVGARDELTYVIDCHTKPGAQIQIQVELLGDDLEPGMARLVVNLEGLLTQEALRRMNLAEKVAQRLRLYAYELEHGPTMFGAPEQAKIDEVQSIIGPEHILSYVQGAYRGAVCLRGEFHTLSVWYQDRRQSMEEPLGQCLQVIVAPTPGAQLDSEGACLAASDSLARTATLAARLVAHYQLDTSEEQDHG